MINDPERFVEKPTLREHDVSLLLIRTQSFKPDPHFPHLPIFSSLLGKNLKLPTMSKMLKLPSHRVDSQLKRLVHLPHSNRVGSALLLAAALALTHPARSQSTLYWDANDATAGFGTAGGVWAAPTTNNSTQGWTTSPLGSNALSGTTNTTTADALNFGTSTDGLSAGTIAVSGTVDANSLTFGSASGAVVLSGGIISLGGTTPTFTVNNAANTISSALIGSAGLTKNGTGTLTLSGNSTYSGATTINAGTLKAGSTTGLSSGSAFTVGSGAALDLAGFNNTISNLSNASAGTITDSSAAGSGATLKVSTALSGTLTNLFTGSLGLNFVGNNILGNANNTYSGGTIYGASSAGSRWIGSGTIGTMAAGVVTNGILGTGAITFGLAATDKAQFYLTGDTVINNSVVVNTALGDGASFGAFRLEGGPLTLNGAINANLADVTFQAQNGVGRIATVNGVVSGNSGLVVLTQGSGGINLTLNSTANANTYAGNTTINGTNSTLTLGKSDQIADGAGKGNLIINSGTFKMGGFSETINGLSGNGTLDGVSGTPILTVGGNNATSTFSGVIKNTTGSLALTKIGTGTLTLSGNNTYSGATSLSGGTLEIGAAGRLGGGSYAGNITNSGTFLYSGTNDQALSGQISGVGSLTKNGTGVLTLSGANSYNGTTTLNAGTLKVGSATGLGNSSTVTMSGGALDINGFDVTVASLGAGNSAGTITNSAAGAGTNTLTVNNFTVNLASLLTDGATAKTGLLFKNASATPWLSNANNTFSGGLTIANGGANTRMYQSGAVTNTLDGNGTLLKSNFGTGNILIGANGSTAVAQFALTTANTTIYNGIVFNAASTYVDGGKAAFRADSSGIKLYGTLTAGASDISFSSGVTGSVTAYGQLTGTNGLTLKSSNITLTLSNNSLLTPNDYSGSTTIETSGTLALGAADQISNGAGKGNLTNNGTFNLAGFSETINGLSGNGTIDGVSGTPTLTVGDNNATSTFSGLIKNTAGTLSLTKNGSGTLTLSGNNSYSGTTTLNVGTISMGHTNALGTTGNISFAGGTLQYGTGITTDISSRLKNSSSAILVDTNGNTVAFASAVDSTNSGGLTKNGSGTLTLSGNNSYSGTTTLNVGTISMGHTNALGTTGNISFAGGTLQYGTGITTDISSRLKNSSSAILVDTNGNTVAFASAVDSTNSGGLTKNGSGALTLSGANAYTGTTTLNGGTLRIGNNSALGTSTLVVNSASAFIDSAVGTSYTLSNNITLTTNGKIGATTAIGNLTFSGIISGAGNLVLDTLGGVTTLTGLNTFTGNVIVDRATVDGGLSFNSIANAGVASALGAGSTILVGIGASAPYLNYIGNSAASSNRTISLVGGEAIITANSAALTLTGNVTASAAQTLRLRGTGGGGANFNELSGVYSGGGSLSVQTATGSDVWKISGNNTFTGTAYVANNAALIAAHSNAFGSTANGTQVNNNAQILLTGNISVGGEALTLNSGAGGNWNGQTGAALRSYTGNNSWAGAITLGQASTIATNSEAGLTLSGDISGSHNLTFNSIGNTSALGNITTGTGTLTKTGAGMLTLSGNNTYTGATTVNAGTLLVNGSLAAGSAVTVASGATLGGTGTLNGATTVNGNLAPGNSPGVLSFGSSLSLGSTAQTTMELNGTIRGTGYDGINVTGNLTYGGSLTIHVGSQFLASSESFSLFTFASESGALYSVSLEGAYGSEVFANNSGAWSATDSSGNQWSFSETTGNLGFTAVPEPSTVAFIVLGFVGILVARFKVQRKA